MQVIHDAIDFLIQPYWQFWQHEIPAWIIQDAGECLYKFLLIQEQLISEAVEIIVE
jgi:hypothetical protein